jgi:hypothetical protein
MATRAEKKAIQQKRTKRDSSAVIAHEAQGNAPKARAERAERKTARVRGKVGAGARVG